MAVLGGTHLTLCVKLSCVFDPLFLIYLRFLLDDQHSFHLLLIALLIRYLTILHS